MIVIALAAAVAMTLAIPVVLTVVVVSIQAEDHRGPLPHQAPSQLALHVRRLTGLRVRQPSAGSLGRSATGSRRSA